MCSFARESIGQKYRTSLCVTLLQGNSWTEALDFDYSLAVGEWIETGDCASAKLSEGLVISPEEAVAQVSRLMTIRQGDLIYIDMNAPARRVEREEVIEGTEGVEDKLYCKIK